MKLKTKLSLSVGVLFLLILLISGVSTIYINALAKDTNNILVANYNTLDYARQMLIALDELPANPEAAKVFEDNLAKQKKNITEIGEKAVTLELESYFNAFTQGSEDKNLIPPIRTHIYELMRLNMRAIEMKSKVAQETARKATINISCTATLCFLIAFSLLINIPGYIANPIRIITESIKEIANKNYSLRLNFESQDEFGEVAEAFNTMADKLKEYERSSLSQLLFEKKRIETLINKMNDPIIGLDEHQRVVFANEQALEILAVKRENMIGVSAEELSKYNDLMRSLTKDIRPELQPQKSKPEQLKIYSDNKECYFEKEIIGISLVPTGEKESKPIGHVILLKNITPFKELDALKTNFISTVSHELKTPVSAILISLNLLEDERVGTLNGEQRQLTRHIREDSERLLKITGELLNMTQVETGKIQLNIQRVDPKEIVQLAVEANKIQAEQSKVGIQLKFPEELPMINADKEKTSWVLTNLISNAIRYSYQQSQIVVEVKKEGGQLGFSVQDSGKGIDSKYLDKIFDRYFRIPGNDKEGTGLGLAISKEFIEAQGGKIGVQSEIGKGSTFYFYLSFS